MKDGSVIGEGVIIKGWDGSVGDMEEVVVMVQVLLVADVLDGLEVGGCDVESLEATVDESHRAHLADIATNEHPQPCQIVVFVACQQFCPFILRGTLWNLWLFFKLLSFWPFLQPQNNPMENRVFLALPFPTHQQF